MRTRYALLFLIVLITITILGVRFIYHAREASRAMSCANNFKLLSLALQNYHDTNGSFPSAKVIGHDGSLIHSWRAMIVPYMEAADCRYDFDEPWDGPSNRNFALGLSFTIKGDPLPPEEAEQIKGYTPPGTYPAPNYGYWCLCPSQHHGEAFITDIVAVTGDKTAWPDSKSVSLKEITDDRATTILLVEINHSDILWSEPRDLRFDLMHFEVNSEKGPSISGPHLQGAGVAFVDGSIARLSDNIPSEIVKAMLTISGGERVDKGELRAKGWLKEWDDY